MSQPFQRSRVPGTRQVLNKYLQYRVCPNLTGREKGTVNSNTSPNLYDKLELEELNAAFISFKYSFQLPEHTIAQLFLNVLYYLAGLQKCYYQIPIWRFTLFLSSEESGTF